MLQALFRKTRADFSSRPLQTVLLFIVIAAAAATLSLALNVQASSREPYERLRREANGADIWVTSRSAGTDLNRLRELPSVTETGEPYMVSWENYGIRIGEKKQQFALVGMGPDLPKFDHSVVTAGRWLDGAGQRELVVDSGAARLLGLDIGQEVDLQTEEGTQTFTVVGFAVTASRAPAPNDDPAFAYMLPATLQALEPDAIFGQSPEHSYRVGVRVADGLAVFEFLEELRVIVPGPLEIRAASAVASDVGATTEFDVIFLQVFSVFALFAAGVIIANAVGGQVLSQLHDLAILKAIGFTPQQVVQAVFVPNLVLSIAASITGVMAGLLLSPFFLNRSASLLGVPAAAAFNPPLLILTVIAVVAIVTLSTIFPAWRAGGVSVAAALAGGDREGLATSRVARLAAASGMPQVAVMGLRDLSRRRMRTTMTVVSLVIVVVTATFSLGLEATFARTMDDPSAVGAPPYDIVADRDTYRDEDARALLDAHPDVESYAAAYYAGGRVGNEGFDLRGIDGDFTARNWPLREGRMPGRAGEAAISTVLANRHGWQVGDEVTVDLADSAAATFTIVGRYTDVDGNVMTVTHDSLPGDAPPSDYFIQVRPGVDHREFGNSIIEASGGNLDPELLSETMRDIRDQFRSVLVALNAVLLSIAGINLLSSLLLSVRERQHDFAILKTVGFTPRQVVLSVFSGSLALALLAVVAGIPIGLLVTRGVFVLVSNTAGTGDNVGTMPGITWLLPILPVAILLAALATILPARRASNLRVAEAMRYE